MWRFRNALRLLWQLWQHLIGRGRVAARPLFPPAVTHAPIRQIFYRDEEHYRPAASRNLRIAVVLVRWPAFFVDAESHLRFAAECLLKHIYCLHRFDGGERADASRSGMLLHPARDHGHNGRKLCRELLLKPHLSASPALNRLVSLLPGGGGWNEERYGARVPTDREQAEFYELANVLRDLMREVDEE